MAASKFPCSYRRRSGIGVKDVDAKELRIGIKVEQEHVGGTKDAQRKACWIALDHLSESRHYYTELLKMEKRLKGVKGTPRRDRRTRKR